MVKLVKNAEILSMMVQKYIKQNIVKKITLFI